MHPAPATGLGGAFSVLTTQAGSQASVPHSDVATAIAALSLITTVSGAIGNAIAASIWTDKVPRKLARYVLQVPGTNQTLVDGIYGSIVVANAQTGDVRQAVLRAYDEVMLLPLALGSWRWCLLSRAFLLRTSTWATRRTRWRGTGRCSCGGRMRTRRRWRGRRARSRRWRGPRFGARWHKSDGNK